ncbi:MULTISPECIES: hypothetical protein [Methylobacter]
MNIDKLNNEEFTRFVITGEIKGEGRFRQTPFEFAGNATSRYALGWPYSGLRLGGS